MARFIGVSAPVYSRYEHGRVPEWDTVTVIADRCGVTVDWLLGRDDSGTSPTLFNQTAARGRLIEKGQPKGIAGAAAAAALGRQERERAAAWGAMDGAVVDALVLTMEQCAPMLRRGVNVGLCLEMLRERVDETAAWFEAVEKGKTEKEGDSGHG